MNRETWFGLATEALKPFFAAQGATLPDKLRIACGFTTSKRAIGQCFYPTGSADGTTEIFIHPGQAEPADVLQILIHELVHAALPVGSGHGPVFKKLALAMGLAGKMTATHAGPVALETIAKVIEQIGPYPHAALQGGGADTPKKQATNPHKNMNCPECGFHAKVLVDQMSIGRLRCPACDVKLLTKEEAE